MSRSERKACEKGGGSRLFSYGVRVRLYLFLFAAALEELGIGEEPTAAQECDYQEQGGQGVGLCGRLRLVPLVPAVTGDKGWEHLLSGDRP